VWALASPELYHLLTTTRGWSPVHYAEWLAESLGSVLLDGDRSRPADARAASPD
jgi:hypothetical protein